MFSLSRRALRRHLCVSVAIATALGVAPTAIADSRPCAEAETAAAAQEAATDLVELSPNATRPTFGFPLADRVGDDDDIQFLAAANRRVPGGTDTVSAQLAERPRNSTGALRAMYLVSARPDEARKAVIVSACISDMPRFRAGQFSGTIDVFGPSYRDFSYAIVVTRKWPWWTAALVLAAAILAFVVVAGVKGSLTFNLPRRRSWVGTVGGVVVAAALAALVYWGTYWKNPTWGDDPQAQITALFVAGFTAASGGLAAVHRFMTNGPRGK